jgi:hypothetical protein
VQNELVSYLLSCPEYTKSCQLFRFNGSHFNLHKICKCGHVMVNIFGNPVSKSHQTYQNPASSMRLETFWLRRSSEVLNLDKGSFVHNLHELQAQKTCAEHFVQSTVEAEVILGKLFHISAFECMPAHALTLFS